MNLINDKFMVIYNENYTWFCSEIYLSFEQPLNRTFLLMWSSKTQTIRALVTFQVRGQWGIIGVVALQKWSLLICHKCCEQPEVWSFNIKEYSQTVVVVVLEISHKIISDHQKRPLLVWVFLGYMTTHGSQDKNLVYEWVLLVQYLLPGVLKTAWRY